jgi:hypothetical protein
LIIKSYPQNFRKAKVREFDNCKNFETGIFSLYSASCE